MNVKINETSPPWGGFHQQTMDRPSYGIKCGIHERHPTHWCSCFCGMQPAGVFCVIYPLVNIQKAIEHGHV